MRKNSIVFGAALLLAVSAAQAQELPALPVDGAPLARYGPYEVVREAAFASAGHIVFRPANLHEFPRNDTLPVMVWANGGCASDSSPYAAFLTTIAPAWVPRSRHGPGRWRQQPVSDVTPYRSCGGSYVVQVTGGARPAALDRKDRQVAASANQ